MDSFLVRVHCITYNQQAYIADAMNGFVIQETNFPYICTIVDDASTDGEQEVIRNYVSDNFDISDASGAYEKDSDYGHVTFARHKINKNCYFAVIYLNENHYSKRKPKIPYFKEWDDQVKYVACCEGDDYWTDPLKLQKQVDFMEEHLDYSLCCHRYKIYNQNEGTWGDDYVKKLFEESPDGFSFGNYENLNKAWITKTMTLVYRKSCINGADLNKYRYRCDEHLNYHLLLNGIGYCFPFIGAVYRRCDTGVFSHLSNREKLERWCRLRGEMLEYNLTDKDIRDHVYHRVRCFLYNRQICREELNVVRVVLKSFYKTDGLRKALVAAKKITGSYVKGLIRNKKNVDK